MREMNNVLTTFLSLPCLDNHNSAQAPESLANFTLSELVACQRRALVTRNMRLRRPGRAVVVVGYRGQYWRCRRHETQPLRVADRTIADATRRISLRSARVTLERPVEPT